MLLHSIPYVKMAPAKRKLVAPLRRTGVEGGGFTGGEVASDHPADREESVVMLAEEAESPRSFFAINSRVARRLKHRARSRNCVLTAPSSGLQTRRLCEQLLLRNIAPQESGLNRSGWLAVENDVRDLVRAGNEAFVIAGPLYERRHDPLPGAGELHRGPSGFWLGDEVQATAFIFDQEDRGDFLSGWMRQRTRWRLLLGRGRCHSQQVQPLKFFNPVSCTCHPDMRIMGSARPKAGFRGVRKGWMGDWRIPCATRGTRSSKARDLRPPAFQREYWR